MIKKNLRVITVLATISIISITLLSGADMTSAVVSCAFTTVDKTMLLESDCFTEKTILIPDGFTLDGNGYIITAIDTSDSNFKGAIIQNTGETAHVTNLKITTSNLENVCDSDDSRLRGIFFKESSGTITNNQIININQGTGNCKEGDAIVVENGPFDGTHPHTKTILIENNYIMQ